MPSKLGSSYVSSANDLAPVTALRAWWLPIVLGIATIANARSASDLLERLQPQAPYFLSVKPDDSLASVVPSRRRPGQRAGSGVTAIIRQLLAVEQRLGGAVLVAPQSLALNARMLRMLGGVELREEKRAPIPEQLARRLQDASIDEPLSIAGRPVYVARDLKPPWTAPLQLVEARGTGRLFVISQQRLEGLRPAGSGRR